MQHQNLNPQEAAAGVHARSTVPSPPCEPTALDPRIEDYLDHVCAPLVGKVPYARRQELRWELSCHLQALVEAFEELGESHDEAVEKAIGQFGDPRALGRDWRGQWQAHRPQPEPLPFRACLPAYFRALCFFVPALGGMWGYFSASSQFPTLSPLELQFFMVLVPATLGGLIGWYSSGRKALGTALALLSVVLMLRLITEFVPSDELFRSPLAMVLVIPALCWLPIASAATGIASRVRARLEMPHRPWAVR